MAEAIGNGRFAGKDYAAVRRGLGLKDGQVYLNTGVIGPLSAAALAAIHAAAESTRESNGYAVARAAADAARAAAARLLGAGAGEVALKNSTTHGILEAFGTFRWQAGDEIVISDLEHHAIVRAAFTAAARHGVVVKYFKGAEGAASLEGQLTAKTKLVAFSHVSFITGERLDAEGLVAAAHAKGVPVLIDGAQSVGAFPVDVKALDVDYYSFPGQKWLFGPQGTGGLYVRRSALDAWRPRVNDAVKQFPYDAEKIFTDIRRFEYAPPAAAVLAGFGASVSWLLDEVGPGEAFRAIADTTAGFREAAARIGAASGGFDVATPEDHAGLVSLKPRGADPKAALAHLKERGVLARTVEPFGYVRFSFSWFVTEDDVTRTLEALHDFFNHQR